MFNSEESFFCLLPLIGELKRARQCLLTDEMKNWLIDFNEYEKGKKIVLKSKMEKDENQTKFC